MKTWFYFLNDGYSHEFLWCHSRTVSFISVFSCKDIITFQSVWGCYFPVWESASSKWILREAGGREEMLTLSKKREGLPQENLLPSCFETTLCLLCLNGIIQTADLYIQKTRNARIITMYFGGSPQHNVMLTLLVDCMLFLCRCHILLSKLLSCELYIFDSVVSTGKKALKILYCILQCPGSPFTLSLQIPENSRLLCSSYEPTQCRGGTICFEIIGIYLTSRRLFSILRAWVVARSV